MTLSRVRSRLGYSSTGYGSGILEVGSWALRIISVLPASGRRIRNCWNIWPSSFKANGLSLKKLQREIMLSAVYQTSAEEPKEAHEKDGSNRLYSHFNRQRLDAESIRDSILFVAGDLDLKEIGGPSKDFGPDNTRRTVYCKVSRFRLNNYLQVFDFPNPSFTAEQRFSTNVPLQRLYFMNNDFVYMQAGKLAERVVATAKRYGPDRRGVSFAFRKIADREGNGSGIAVSCRPRQKNPGTR